MTADSLVTQEVRRRSRWIWLVSWAGFWTLIGLFMASQRVVRMIASGNPEGWPREAAAYVVAWYVWGVLSLGVVRLARRYPLERGLWKRHLPIHAVASVVAALLQVLIDYPLDRLIGFVGPESFRGYALMYLQGNIPIYWVIVGVHYAFEYHRLYRDREVRALELESRLAKTRLSALENQLHPHFLFNTLHAVSSLMHKDVAAAERMIAQLSDLLRMTLSAERAAEIPLSEELALLDRYLEIMRTRFPDRLRVRMEIEPGSRDARVPSFLLQPLVENAIRHGISRRVEGGRLEVGSRLDNGTLELRVRDDGPGYSGPIGALASSGMGLSNTRARLEQLYGANHRFEAGNHPEGGFEVAIALPARIGSRARTSEPAAAR